MIESEDNAENTIYHVISEAILKNVYFGTFSNNIFGKLFFSVKYNDFKFAKKPFWSNFVEPGTFNEWTILPLSKHW